MSSPLSLFVSPYPLLPPLNSAFERILVRGTVRNTFRLWEDGILVFAHAFICAHAVAGIFAYSQIYSPCLSSPIYALRPLVYSLSGSGG
jgi:hypothetical protein